MKDTIRTVTRSLMMLDFGIGNEVQLVYNTFLSRSFLML